ncbi:MAG: glycosyltransferase [Nitrospiraceae bacterium]|nr:MAG: glycosyltransferase [Nitrospiraceae bacterium]
MLRARLIALYLPQFHPIPENDGWWGKGFTEWTNVAKARSLFTGHHQPNIPGDLGLYDLRVPYAREAQAEIAKDYGIEGFCYWHYWFGGGKRLLERPFNEVLQSGSPDFPFCLAWANHSWSGVWHGCPDRILIEQTYPGKEDIIAHFYAMLPAFRDPRYMKIDNRNIFAVYKPRDLRGPKEFIETWRELAIKEGLSGFYFIAMVDYPWDPPEDGYDAFTTNPPVAMVTRQNVPPLNGETGLQSEGTKLPQIYSYESFVTNAFPGKIRGKDFFPCVVPNWDNTPRSGVNGFVLHESTPELYGRHLSDAVELVADRSPDQRIVFIKSWNEWAETNYLEPDLRWGKAYLKTTVETVAKGGSDALRVHFINVRTMHHSAHSGYDRFMDYIPNDPLPSSNKWKIMPEDKRKQAYADARAHITWYNTNDLEMETNVNAFEPDSLRHICHFLYGENSVCHIDKSLNPQKKIFVTFHQPPEAHQQFILTRAPLKNIDGIIVVGTNQVHFFEQYVERSKIHLVPHGVDVDFFKPDDSMPKDPNKILFVGNWLRDFETLKHVANILRSSSPEIIIDVVTLERNRALFEGIENIRFHTGLSEDELLNKYQSASLLLIPMKDCTANNSVLEGMACGLPIVTTDIGGIRDYVDEDCAVLCRPADAEGMAGAVLDLRNDRGRMAGMSKGVRKKAAQFSWPLVAKTLLEAYAVSFTR